jgi:hypothetical protein
MRVRLINPFTAQLRRLDTVATSAAGGYDNEFAAVNTKTVAGKRVVERVEKPPMFVVCQVEDQTFKSLRQMDAGNSPEAKMGLVCDRYLLDRDGHIDRESGLVRIQVNDRLERLVDNRGNLVHIVPQVEGGLYCVEVRPISYGIGRRLDLILLRFNDRQLSQQG